MQVDLELTWNKRVKDVLELIKSTESKDRLGYVASIALCPKAISDSMQGWLFWASNSQIMSNFDEPTLQKFQEKLRATAIELLEFDLETTDLGIAIQNQNRPPESGSEAQ